VNIFQKQVRTLFALSAIFLSAHLHGQNVSQTSTDTTRQSPKPVKKQGLEGPIHYEAQNIENRMDEKQTVLTGKAKVTSQDMTLTAAKIMVDWDKRFMFAEGLPDSIWTKTENGDSVKTLRLTGLPEFNEAGDVMKGEVMTYNFETRRGRVLRGRTKWEDGYYNGETLKMLNSKTLNVAEGSYTTCSLDTNPHFHFWSKQMKILINDKVIAKPIVLYAGHIPVFALPFVLFPVKKGRHSGILIPRYGESSLEGRYLRGIGYYWAPSDYWDVEPSIDFFEKSGFLFRADMNYQVRYKLSGSVSGSWTRKNFEIGGLKERRWDLRVNHTQNLSPTATLMVYGNLVSSGNFYRELSSSREYRLQKEIYSNATLTKRFGGSWSTTVNLNQTRNLSTGEITESLPQISIRGGQTPIIPISKGKKRGRTEIQWYNQVYVSYSSNLLSRRSLQKSASDGHLVEQKAKGWDHSLRLSSSQKLFGWLNLNPSVNYREQWFDRSKVFSLNSKTNSVESNFKSGFYARRLFDLSASFGTKLYGTFYPWFLKEVVFRHVATPSVSYRYQPNFSEDRFGYFQTIEDTLGKVYRKDRFENSLFGSTSSSSSKSLYFSLDNLFQMKIGEGEKAKRINLFNYTLSSSYNWKAKEYRLGDLNSAFRANPLQNMDVSFRALYNFYQTDVYGNKINRLFIDDINWGNWRSIFRTRWLRMNSFGADVNFRLSGKAGGSREAPGTGSTGETSFGESPKLESLQNISGDRYEMSESEYDFNIPWNLSASLSYSENRSNPLRTSKSFWAHANLDFKLTKNWKISYQTQFDLKQQKVVSQDFSLYRDLHCWEAQVLWTPTGYNKRFYFRINIKSPMLKELKYERGTGTRGLYGGY
jgi:lipopolysaccharide assembly outer membrane protein LptD (OstA)